MSDKNAIPLLMIKSGKKKKKKKKKEITLLNLELQMTKGRVMT